MCARGGVPRRRSVRCYAFALQHGWPKRRNCRGRPPHCNPAGVRLPRPICHASSGAELSVPRVALGRSASTFRPPNANQTAGWRRAGFQQAGCGTLWSPRDHAAGRPRRIASVPLHSPSRDARAAHRHRHVPLQRHRGVDPPAAVPGRRLAGRPRAASRDPARRVRHGRRSRGGHRGRLLLRRLPDSTGRGGGGRRGAAGACRGGVATGRGGPRPHRSAHRRGELLDRYLRRASTSIGRAASPARPTAARC